MPFALLMHDPLAGTLMLLALLWLSAKLGGEQLEAGIIAGSTPTPTSE